MDKIILNKFNLKSNKGLVMQELIIAMAILLIFVVIIGSTFIMTYKIQAETQIAEVATVEAIKIIEYIDKISYEDVTNGMEEQLIELFNIPSSFNLAIEVSNYNPEGENSDIVKTVTVNIDYTYNQKQGNIVMKRLKIKEL